MNKLEGAAKQLGTITATLVAGSSQWPSVWIIGEEQLREVEGEEIKKVGVDRELFACLTTDNSHLAGLPEGEAYPERFWRSLLEDWAPAFREPMRSRAAIGNFYEMYGPVTPFGAANNYESLEAVRLSIEWFATVAKITKWLKDEKYAPLREWFETPLEKRDGADYFSTSIPGVEGSERLAVSFYPYYSGDIEQSEVEWVQPRDDTALASEAWRAVMYAVWDRLREIPLAVVMSDFRHTKEPSIIWGFEPRGALDAAFLLWFFEELASVSVTKCEGCDNIVTGRRQKWCSNTCRERVYKQRQRDKKK